MAEAARGSISTILFTDVVDSTALMHPCCSIRRYLAPCRGISVEWPTWTSLAISTAC